MPECDYAGCADEPTDEVPTLERPSPIPRHHPDYKPPHTTLHLCDTHAAHARLRAAALEAHVLDE